MSSILRSGVRCANQGSPTGLIGIQPHIRTLQPRHGRDTVRLYKSRFRGSLEVGDEF
jgi:hypothetical protein